MDLQTALAEIRSCLAFYTRLPLAPAPGAPVAMFAFERAAWAVPVAGALVGALAALAFCACDGLGLGGPVAATAAVGTLAAATGAIHEDGLADCADGFGGGATPARKLEIMRDSRLGTYGVLALVLTTGLRAAALAHGAAAGDAAVAAFLVFAGALSRTCALWPLAALPAARTDGAGAHAGTPTRAGLRAAALLACLAGVPSAALGGPGPALAALVLAALAAAAVTALARRQIGGQTGDVIGAAQQAAEIAACLAFAAT